MLADDPRLTVRIPGDLTNPPRRVVMDSMLRTPPTARLFDRPGEGEAAGPVTILTHAGYDAPRARALQDAGAEIVGLHAGERGRVALRDAHTWMWEAGVRRS